jgi:hypothetical protein
LLTQESIDYDALDAELPDLADLFSGAQRRNGSIARKQIMTLSASSRTSGPVPAKVGENEKAKTLSGLGRRRARRVVVSDDEE